VMRQGWCRQCNDNRYGYKPSKSHRPISYLRERPRETVEEQQNSVMPQGFPPRRGEGRIARGERAKEGVKELLEARIALLSQEGSAAR
jgi:predicted  nucleic acid-binding Zn-ribbon protein